MRVFSDYFNRLLEREAYNVEAILAGSKHYWFNSEFDEIDPARIGYPKKINIKPIAQALKEFLKFEHQKYLSGLIKEKRKEMIISLAPKI